jgi:hypothetical protein
MTRALNALILTAALAAAGAANAQPPLKPYYKIAATPVRALIVASGGMRDGAIVQSQETTVTNSALLHVNDPVWRDAEVQFDCDKHQVRRKPTANLSRDRKVPLGAPAAGDWSEWRAVAAGGADAAEEALLCLGKVAGLTGYADLLAAQRAIYGAMG